MQKLLLTKKAWKEFDNHALGQMLRLAIEASKDGKVKVEVLR